MNLPNFQNKSGIMESLRLEGTLEDFSPSCCPEHSQVHQVAQDCVQLGFKYFQRLHKLSRQPVPMFDHTRGKKVFLISNQE